MATVLDAPPRPQALFVGFEDEDPAFIAMARMVRRALIVRSSVELRALRLNDWDLAVFAAEDGDVAVASLPSHIHVFAYGGSSTGMVDRDKLDMTTFRYEGEQVGPTLYVHVDAADVSEGIRRLVKRELVPWLQEQHPKPFLVSKSSTRGPAFGTTFVRDADRNPIAGHYYRRRSRDDRSSDTRILIVPFTPVRPEAWLAAAIDVWREVTPRRFEDMPTWRDSPKWQTADERRLRGALADLERERDEILKRLNERQTELEGDLTIATAAGEQGRRRLLTESGQGLVSAVVEAFEYLGFEVTDADAERAKGTPRLEDLRLTDPDVPEWSNVTEIKGVGGGGRHADLFDLNRYAGYYLERTGSWPSSRWYVVNQMRHEDPDRRHLLFGGGDEILDSFANDGGLAIDTRHLFELLHRIDVGSMSEEQARQMLRTQRGRFEL